MKNTITPADIAKEERQQREILNLNSNLEDAKKELPALLEDALKCHPSVEEDANMQLLICIRTIRNIENLLHNISINQ